MHNMAFEIPAVDKKKKQEKHYAMLLNTLKIKIGTQLSHKTSSFSLSVHVLNRPCCKISASCVTII